MKPEIKRKKGDRAWWFVCGWATAALLIAILLYVSGGIAARVLYMKGVIRDGSRTLSVIESAYTPLNGVYSYNPTFRRLFDSCVTFFVPELKEEK
ncbi:MAG: hypothetical protein AB1705_11395 [Verrucomicrobiota bacterium]